MLGQHPDAKVSIVLCGDFNSRPEYDHHMGGVLQLMTQGKVDENHLDWKSRDGEEVKGISLDSNTLFFSAAGTHAKVHQLHSRLQGLHLHGGRQR